MDRSFGLDGRVGRTSSLELAESLIRTGMERQSSRS